MSKHTVTSATLWQLVLPVLWFGTVAAISFIEAPLKFQAPGITIPLGLGIGRLVFMALNIVEGVILVCLLVAGFASRPARVTGARLWVLIGLAAVFISKVTLVRPPLNARTDLVLEGADPGQSPWHYVYIVCDVVTLALLVWFTALTMRILRRALLHTGTSAG